MKFNPEKIVVIANGFQENYIVNYLNALANNAVHIDFLGSGIYQKTSLDSKINFIDVRGGGISNLSFLQKVFRVVAYYTLLLKYFVLHPGKYAVHVHWLRFKIPDGIILPMLLRATGKKMVYTVHDVVPHNSNTVLNRLLFWVIYRTNQKLIAHTGYIKTRLCNEFKINPDRIGIIKHGVYKIDDHLILKNKHKAKELLKIDQGVKLVLFFGFISPYKGLDLLLEALANMADNNDIALLVAGRVNEDYKSTLAQLSKTYSDKIDSHYIIRKIEDEELPLIFGAADITAIPYREASQSGVLFMSYAYGVPVIVPDIGGFPYDVIPEKSGYIFRCNDTLSLTNTLERFCKNHAAGSLWGSSEIRDFARRNYSWDESVSQLVKFINT